MNGPTVMIGQLGRREEGMKLNNYQTIIDILLTNGLLIRLFSCPFFLSSYRSTKKALIDQ